MSMRIRVEEQLQTGAAVVQFQAKVMCASRLSAEEEGKCG
jgi:hypothetical protein